MTTFEAFAKLVDGLEAAGYKDCTAEMQGYYNDERETVAILYFKGAESSVSLIKGFGAESRVVKFTNVTTETAVQEVLSVI